MEELRADRPDLTGPDFNTRNIAEEEANEAIRGSFRDFTTNNSQFIDDQIASLSENSLVTDAISRSNKIGERTNARSSRAAARSGLGMSPAQRASLKRLTQLGTSTAQVDTVNNARTDQIDRNARVALGLSQQGEQLRSQGLNSLVNSAGLASQRGRDFTLNRANRNGAFRSLATTGASAALTAFV